MQTSRNRTGWTPRAAHAKVLRQENNVWVPGGAARTPECMEEHEQRGEEEGRSENRAWTGWHEPWQIWLLFSVRRRHGHLLSRKWELLGVGGQSRSQRIQSKAA